MKLKDLPPRIRELFDKNFRSSCYDGIRMTRSEKRELENYFREQGELTRSMHRIEFWEMLITSHPEYAQPDINGFIKII